MNVLVVDDNEINRKLLRVMLSADGHRRVECGNGVEALETLEQDTFDDGRRDGRGRKGGHKDTPECRAGLGASQGPMNVLIVDDNQIDRKLLRMTLATSA